MTGSSTESLNITLAGAAPKSIHCSRHRDGKPFELRKEIGLAEPTVLAYTDLERILSNRMMRIAKKAKPALARTQIFENSGTKMQQQHQKMQQQIFLCPRRDVAFLKCFDMSPYHKIRTILGIPEDHQCPQVESVCYQAKECEQQKERLIRRGPHSDWKRTPIIAQDLKHKNDLSGRNESTKISWIDLRKFQTKNCTGENGSFLSTEAGVIQFLRSLLTPSHDASPWEAAAKPKKSSEEIKKSCLPSPEIIVLVLNYPSSDGYENDFSLLKKFRVSDAAPSWFLHGFTHLETLEQSLDEVFHRNTEKQVSASTLASTLLIYKKLSNRRSFHTSNPEVSDSDHNDRGFESVSTSTSTECIDKNETEETARIDMKGCLWEEYEEKEDDDKFPEQSWRNKNCDAIATSKESHNSKKNHRCRLVSPPYLNLDEEYFGANLLAKLFSKDALRIFTEDALSVPRWTPWPETAHYKVSSFGNEKPWTVFPLCYCFPANAPDKFTWVPSTKSFVPRTCRLLEEALRYGNGQSYLRTALFSQMAPRSVLEEHTGWADLANHVLRLHIPLVVPNNIGNIGDNDDLCGTWVDGCVETHAVGRPLLFDDSKTHRAFNYSDCDRIVLIVDLARPEKLPLGTAESGHTEELDSFIAQMSAPK